MSKETLPVIELFGPTIQGEGPLCGHRSHFIRFGGCPYRCVWCDSMHAVDPAQVKANKTEMTPDEIIQAIMDLPGHATWVTLTGGDPVMWDLYQVVAGLQNRDYQTSVETEGYLWQDWLNSADAVVVSPKPPSSGMHEKFDASMLERYSRALNQRMAIKVVIFDRKDLDWAKTIHKNWPRHKFYLSVGTPRPIPGAEALATPVVDVLEGLRNLAHEVLMDNALSNAILLPQMHVLIWGHKQGV